MLKEIILINSANFDFARVKLDKDLFFLGDNGSGKTSFIRAIHFLYSGDVKSLAIPSDKMGFKEYYFRYDDSYIFYVFEEFFIFMYKTSNEIIKIFSAQKFDLNKIKDGSTLLDFKEIRSYVKNVFSTSAIKGIGDYQDIIYGANKRYLDFKIANIKNKDIFLKLFHSVFNIDKAIIDAKSIKKAIFTSLELHDSSESFEPEFYIEQLNTFSYEFRFINDMQKQEKNIQKIKELKEKLLFLEDELQILLKKINYRVEYEANLKETLTAKIENLQKKLQRVKNQIKIKSKKLDSFKEKSMKYELTLESELKSIEELKEQYSLKKLHDAKQQLLLKQEVEDELNGISEQIIKLQEGYSDAIKSIDDEIKRLFFKKDSDLKAKFEVRFNQELVNQQNQIQQQIENLEDEVEKKELKILQKQDKIQELVKEKDKSLEENSINIKNLQAKLQDKKELFFQQNEELKALFYKSKQDINEKIFTLQNQIQKLSSKRYTISSNYKKQKRYLKQTYSDEISEIKKQLQIYKQMAYTKEGSFKEFLEENFIEWERELYPIINDELLLKDSKELQPKVVGERLLGIELKTKNLKKILSKDEAKKMLEQLKRKIDDFNKAYKQTKVQLNQNFSEDIAKLNDEKTILKNKISHFQSTIKKESIKNEQQQKLLKEEFEKTKATSEKDIQEILRIEIKISEEQKNLANEIKKLTSLIKQNRQKLKQKKQNLLNSIDTKHIEKSLQKEFEVLYKEIDSKIEALKIQKSGITKDKRLDELLKQKEILEKKLQSIIEAKQFLDLFELKKEFISKEAELKKELILCNDYKKRVIDTIKKRKKSLFKEEELLKEEMSEDKKIVVKIEKGLLKAIKSSDETLESESFLDEVVDEYENIQRVYEKQKLTLISLLSKINKIDGLKKYDIYFDTNHFDEEENFSKLNSILINIENLHELYTHTLSTLKKSLNTKFENFVKVTVTKKLDLFSNAKESFINLVLKINRHLRDVDFGVIESISLQTNISDDDSIAKMLLNLKERLTDISTLFVKESLFFDMQDATKILLELEDMFIKIKKELKSNKISLVDTIDLSLDFVENGKKRVGITQIKNESSTGGSMLLKIALAISILKVYLKESQGVFFLIVDEVARLHSNNQKRLKSFANEAGFKIIFVTPEPVFANAKELKYYKFEKKDEKFFVIELNA
jgi:hypothetical protein